MVPSARSTARMTSRRLPSPPVEAEGAGAGSSAEEREAAASLPARWSIGGEPPAWREGGSVGFGAGRGGGEETDWSGGKSLPARGGSGEEIRGAKRVEGIGLPAGEVSRARVTGNGNEGDGLVGRCSARSAGGRHRHAGGGDGFMMGRNEWIRSGLVFLNRTHSQHLQPDAPYPSQTSA